MPSRASSGLHRYQTALVTGASSGIGQALAEALLAAGLTVYGTSRHPGRQHDSRIRWLAFEGASQEGLATFLQTHDDLLSKIDLLINNSGAGLFGSITDIPEERLSGQQCLLLEAPVRLTRAALEGMRQRGRGAIVNVSSLAALCPLPYLGTYSACKAGLSAFTETLRQTERDSGICLIDLQLGDFRTAFNAHMERFGEASAEKDAVWERLEANIAAGPDPSKAANDLLQALRRGRSRTVRSGGFFQCRLMPIWARVAPRPLFLWSIRKYYRLP